MIDLHNYNLPATGKTENILNINLLKYLQTKNTSKFVQNYKISNFWKGKYFIKRLINKIFKYKLNLRMIWDSKFWDKIDIQINTINKMWYSTM